MRYAAVAARAQTAQAIAAAASAASVGHRSAREAARINSYMEPTIVLSAADAGDGTATVTVLAHRRVYPVQGSIKVPDVELIGGSVTGAPLGSDGIAIYYADPTLADTAPTFHFAADFADAQAGIAAGMHLVGIVPTPLAGAAATTGSDGATPPTYGKKIDTRSL